MEGKSEEDILGDPEEIELIAAIDQQKRAYKENFEELRGLKAEIEQIQKLLEKMRTKMTHDFESWYEFFFLKHLLNLAKRNSIF